jgi:hypothetical protein
VPYRITITEPQPQFPFVSFAAFRSNPLGCLLLGIDRTIEAVGPAQHIDADRPAHRKGRYIWLRHLDPEDDRRTGASLSALPDYHHSTPTAIPFVSFAAFCSNPLGCLLLGIDRTIEAGR